MARLAEQADAAWRCRASVQDSILRRRRHAVALCGQAGGAGRGVGAVGGRELALTGGLVGERSVGTDVGVVVDLERVREVLDGAVDLALLEPQRGAVAQGGCEGWVEAQRCGERPVRLLAAAELMGDRAAQCVQLGVFGIDR